jgi:hypothetical protein
VKKFLDIFESQGYPLMTIDRSGTRVRYPPFAVLRCPSLAFVLRFPEPPVVRAAEPHDRDPAFSRVTIGAPGNDPSDDAEHPEFCDGL